MVSGRTSQSNRGDAKELQNHIAMREESARQFLSHAAALEKACSALGKVSVEVELPAAVR